MRRLKVLLVTRVDRVDIGGVQLSTLIMANALQNVGHQVYVMCNSDHPFVDEFTKQGLTVVSAPLGLSILSLITDVGILRRFVAQNPIDIVHFQYARSAFMAPFCRGARKSAKVRTVWTCRGIQKRAYWIMGPFANRFIDVVIGNCQQERDKLIQRGVSSRKVAFAYNPPAIGIPEDTTKDSRLLKEFNIDSTAPVIGTASRLSPERGVKYFIEAAAKILVHNSHVKFVIAGGGPLEQKLKELAESLQISQHIRFVGTRRDMSRVYSILDIFVNPIPAAYGVAGTGNTTAEAMVCARPVVTTGAGGIAEMVVDGVTGIVVPSRDSDALAAACLRLLNDRKLMEEMGKAGRARILSKFTSRHLVEELERCYSQALADD
ncbi:MAG: glycosyltransferase family 4 protein [Nitrospirae bacterium]|nr:glycosyltransferase family 4 protein [Nitrospirota bacterium]